MAAASALPLPFSPRTALRQRLDAPAVTSPHRPDYHLYNYPSPSRRCSLYRHRIYPRQNVVGREMISQVKLKDDVDDETCELVNGVELMIGEDQDSIPAYLLKAVKNNNGTGVLLLSDVMGFEDSLTRDFAYRVACIGYNVLIPDLFRGNPWKKDQSMTEFEHWFSRQSPERVAKDISMSAKWMTDEFMAAGISKKLGIIGFCFGGGHLVETLARDEQAYFGTGVCFYGTNINPSLGSSIKVPVLLICGDNDLLCPISSQQEMEKNTRGSKLKIYSGRGHGFAHRPNSEEEDEDAEAAFAIMRNWLNDNLLVRKDHS
ncbi:carboxymethylenebutenolidase [Cocos nucifera]|uniref:Carboxymethylenebutenolidase homolog n=1 Tax=Cocos nucifera TaxID=13894 RepID=A0A8K0MVW4_COCNU|nr:carboxymethylenebutenolidase [Cocos nucifera]